MNTKIIESQDPSSSGISHKDQVLLEKCREIELLSRDLYNCFAESYTENPEAVHLWRKTACEEQNHADQFTLALKLRKGLHMRTDASLEKSELIIQSLKKTIPSLKNSTMSQIGRASCRERV